MCARMFLPPHTLVSVRVTVPTVSLEVWAPLHRLACCVILCLCALPTACLENCEACPLPVVEPAVRGSWFSGCGIQVLEPQCVTLGGVCLFAGP